MGGRGGTSGLSAKNQKISFKGLPTLKGSEKQVKWAEQIRNNAIDTINKNIDLANERIKKYPSAQKKYQNEIESLQEIGKQLKEVLLKSVTYLTHLEYWMKHQKLNKEKRNDNRW